MKNKLFWVCSLFFFLLCGCFSLSNLNIFATNSNIGSVTADSVETVLPEEYCMRDEYIILAQHQDKHGYCWNFAASMAATTTIMKATNEYYDFSELWAGISSHKVSNSYKLGAGGSFTTFNSAKNAGGLMLESDLPYQNSYIVSNENAIDFYNFYKEHSNQDLADCVKYDSKTYNLSSKNVYAIKNHIYNHGSVYLSFYFKQGFIEENEVFYKVPNQKNTNSHHAVSVIGWDDNFVKEVYIDGYDTPIIYKGAWIVLNSYTENNGRDGISLLFYDDTNISSVYGYKYVQDTTKELYFYDKIESGYAYPTNVVGKYCGDFTAKTGLTKQKNIFYDDVDLEYSYIISDNANIKSVEIYLDNVNVSSLFNIKINSSAKKFTISKENADFGNYKVLVTYGNNKSTKTYLNNFFVTHGLIREETEFGGASDEFSFNKGKDLEYYSHNQTNKNFVIYTNKLSGVLTFNSQENSVYTETPILIENIPYEITNGVGCNVTRKVTAATGYELEYNFYFEYCEDTTKQPVYVFYDLDGGINHPENFNKELANQDNDLVLYAPTREGYTFAGWYLDYGHGSKKLTNIDNVYYLDWDDIHHMGENPTLNALSYYKNYYNNSNTIFVYAHWEEVEYYNVNVTINGEGSVGPNRNILMNSNDVVVYNFKASSGWNLFKLTINGVAVSNEELSEILKNGLVLQNLTEDVNIEAVFIEGVYLLLNVGENIKTAYVKTTLDGTAYKFYNGDLIGNNFLNKSKFALVVELYDDVDGYTFMLRDAENYEYISKGIYSQAITISKTMALKEVNVADAIKKKIVTVNFSYSVNDYVLDHYISEDKNATSGVKNGGDFTTGQIIYLFIYIPSKTAQYNYTIPSGFEKINRKVSILDNNKFIGLGEFETSLPGVTISPSLTNNGGWYRKRIYIDPDNADFGEVNVERIINTYTIYFKNWDGTTLYYERFDYGAIPIYTYSQDGKTISYPKRNSDKKYDYVFVGWNEFFSPVTGSKTYTAVYDKIARQYNIIVEPCENGSVSPAGNNLITCEDKHTYIFLPNEGYKIKDVKIDGVSVGAVNYYTFTNVDSSHTVNVEFEIIKFNIHPIIEGEGTINSETSLENISYGEDRELILTSKNGWELANVFVDGKKVEVVDNKVSLSNIKSDIQILVIFKKNNTSLIVSNFVTAFLIIICLSLITRPIFDSINKFKLVKRK